MAILGLTVMIRVDLYTRVDITATGILVSRLSDDNSVGPILMPNFEYYGQTELPSHAPKKTSQ